MSAGMLYIGLPGDENLEPLGEIADYEVIIEKKAMDAYDAPESFTAEETSIRFHMTQEQLNNFFDEVLRIKDQVLRIIRNEGNARVCHLAKRGSKARTREKNVRRAFRILEKEG